MNSSALSKAQMDFAHSRQLFQFFCINLTFLLFLIPIMFCICSDACLNYHPAAFGLSYLAVLTFLLYLGFFCLMLPLLVFPVDS